MFYDFREFLSHNRNHHPWKVPILSMKNIEMKLEGTILTMKVDISKDFGPSKSGKSITVASTEGNISVPGAEDVKIGVNVYKGK